MAHPRMKPHPGYDSTFIPVDSIARFKQLTYTLSDTVGQGVVINTILGLFKFDRTYFNELHYDKLG